MSVIESISVHSAAPYPECLRGFFIDAPQSRSGLPTHVVEIIGWVLGQSSPAVAVLVKRDDIVLGRDPVHRHRPDVAAAYPQVLWGLRCGFRVSVETDRVVGSVMDVQALLADGSEILLGKIMVGRHSDRRRYVVERLRNRLVEDQSGEARRRLQRLVHPAHFGTLRRTRPLSDSWGWDRGTPVDRYFIARFLEEHRSDIRGRVLEVRDAIYTERYGTQVDDYDVVDVDATNPNVTIVTDLEVAAGIPSNSYDCFVMTQTLQVIYDFRSAVWQAYRILRPGGVLLATVPALSKLTQYPSDYWRFTPAACSMLFESVFGVGSVDVRSYGNVLTGIAFLTGIACEELSQRELLVKDDLLPMLVTVRAVKALQSRSLASQINSALLPGAVHSQTRGSESARGNRSGLGPETRSIAAALEGLVGGDSRILIVGGPGAVAGRLREQGYRATTVGADGASLPEDSTALESVIRSGISSDPSASEVVGGKFDLALVPDFPSNPQRALALIELLRTLLVSDGCVVVLAQLADGAEVGTGWTPVELRDVLESAPLALTRLEQRLISDFNEEASETDVDTAPPSMTRLLAVAYCLTDQEIVTMWQGLRDSATDYEVIQSRLRNEITWKDAQLTEVRAELQQKSTELEVVYRSRTWRGATLYWKVRQKLR